MQITLIDVPLEWSHKTTCCLRNTCYTGTCKHQSFRYTRQKNGILNVQCVGSIWENFSLDTTVYGNVSFCLLSFRLLSIRPLRTNLCAYKAIVLASWINFWWKGRLGYIKHKSVFQFKILGSDRTYALLSETERVCKELPIHTSWSVSWKVSTIIIPIEADWSGRKSALLKGIEALFILGPQALCLFWKLLSFQH